MLFHFTVFLQPARGKFIKFHHLTFWVGNAKQVNIYFLLL